MSGSFGVLPVFISGYGPRNEWIAAGVDQGRAASRARNIAPFALSLEAKDVPVVHLPGAKVRVPVGSFGAVRSPLTPPTEVTMLDISLEEGAELAVPVAADRCAFVMPIFGTVLVDGQSFGLNDFKVPVSQAQGEAPVITLEAAGGSAKVMFFDGRPLHFDPA